MQLSYNGHNPFLEQAALWATVLEEEDTVAHRAAFGRWLKESSDHVEAVLVLSAAVHEAHRFKVLCEQLQRIASATTIVAPAEASNDPTLPRFIRHRLGRWIGTLVWVPALCAVVLVFVIALPTVRPKPAVIPSIATSTADSTDPVIEHAGFVSLGPQSLMRLEAHSRVRDHVLPHGAGHEITVLEGAAYFSGQHGPSNSLKVRSGRLAIDVLGTAFKVENAAGRTAIAVFQGTVQVTRCDTPSTGAPSEVEPSVSTLSATVPTVLKTNQIATASTNDCVGALEVKRMPSAQSVSGESGGWLSFHNTPVDQAAEMFNRANSHYLIVVNDAVAKLRIGGHFRTSDLDGFILGLQALGVRAVRDTSAPEGIIIYLVR